MRRIFPVLLAITVLVAPTVAGTMSEDEKAVWSVIEKSWKAINDEEVGWSDKFVLPDALVWGSEYPLPRNRDSVKSWDRFNFENSTTLASEFSVGGIVVHGDTAVAHYYYSLGVEDREGKRKTTHGRCTDILARDGGKWKFLAWHCGDTPTDD